MNEMNWINLEFLPWYQAGVPMVRCGGDDGCGSILMEGDTELHRKWHRKMFPYDVPLPQSGPTVIGKATGCSSCGRDRACGGPHDCGMM